MVMLQVLLLLLLTSAAPAPTATSPQQWCGRPTQPECAVIARQCREVPCDYTTQGLTLALPVLLTLNLTNQHTPTKRLKKNPFPFPDLQNRLERPKTAVTQPPTAWVMRLEVQDEAEKNVGMVDLNSEEDYVAMNGLTFHFMRKGNTSIPFAQKGSQHLHLAVTVQERELRLIHVTETKNTTEMALYFRGFLPSRIKVTSATGYGYSALTTITTTTTTTTTTAAATAIAAAADATTTTNAAAATQAVGVVVSILVGVSVMVSVGMLALVSCGRLEAEALLRTVQAAPTILHLQ
ncbi:hypothetical protein E2C01_088595 [Portunus trituberculatus]|uniref:Uncharacterized protein n=1 Tax=Portunus trituberculatus TaxID=210409 RepID=A0A5B7JJT8_PORTR|nr:hypothetical protein [Portunus trituberculatus]